MTLSSGALLEPQIFLCVMKMVAMVALSLLTSLGYCESSHINGMGMGQCFTVEQ